MHFPEDEEGDFGISSATRSRLSSLFQAEGARGDVNDAFTFNAPKQPKKTDKTQNSPALKLIHSAVVHAYKLQEGSYVNQGRLGCVILGLHENAVYQLLLYKGKQVHVTSCVINPSFSFQVQPNNYANFYNEKAENWSLNFDSEAALIDFTKQVALAKANSEPKSPTSLVIQDLSLGDGSTLDQGDSAEIRYTGWLLTNHSFGSVFDSNLSAETAYRLKLGKSKIIKGWTDGLKGLQKGAKRLLIIPSSLAYGAEGKDSTIPPNATLIFEVTLTKLKKSRESSHSPSPKPPEAVPDKKPEVMPRGSISHEDNIRTRGASISEQLSQSPKKDKAQLISRMAKMGTATLPFKGAIPVKVDSESEDEDEVETEDPPQKSNDSRSSSPKLDVKPSPRKISEPPEVKASVITQPAEVTLPLQNVPPSAPLSMYSQATVHSQQMYMTPTTYPSYQSPIPSPFHIPNQPQYPVPSSGYPHMVPNTPMMDSHWPMLMSESRSQNAEVRMSLSKITDKVETVIQKVDELKLQGRGPSIPQLPHLDSSILVQNIERIVQENGQLKQDVESKNSEIQSLNKEICALYQRNQRFFEENNSILDQRRESLQMMATESQTKLSNLEQTKVKLTSELSDATSKIAALESELKACQELETQWKQKLKDCESEVESQSNNSNEDKETLLSSLQAELQKAEEEKNRISKTLTDVEDRCQKLIQSETSLKENLEETKLAFKEYRLKAENLLIEKEKSLEKDELSVNQQADERNALLKKKSELEKDCEDLRRQLKHSKTTAESAENRAKELETELEKALLWKKKYEVFYQKTRALKDNYDSQIMQLTSEIQKLKQSNGVGPSSADFSGEIKKVMNSLYKLLQGKFEANTSYTGSKVLETTLQAIKVQTMRTLQIKSRTSSDSSVASNDSGKPAPVPQPIETRPAESSTDTNQSVNGTQNDVTKNSKDSDHLSSETESIEVIEEGSKIEQVKLEEPESTSEEPVISNDSTLAKADSSQEERVLSSTPPIQPAVVEEVKRTDPVQNRSSPDAVVDVFRLVLCAFMIAILGFGAWWVHDNDTW